MHQIILLRHAKAAWPDGVEDLARPLAERGLADATVAAYLIAGGLPVPDLVLCSPALRTRQTFDVAGARLDPAPAIRLEPVIYGAGPDELIGLLAALPEDCGTALIVGHEPTMSRTALTMAGPGSDEPDLTRIEHKYPTCGIALLRASGTWAELSPGTAVLQSFDVPRAT